MWFIGLHASITSALKVNILWLFNLLAPSQFILLIKMGIALTQLEVDQVGIPMSFVSVPNVVNTE